MRERSLRVLGPVGFRRLAYTEWGPRDGRAVICVHGLTRQARDFDALAATLAPRRRVACPDMAGRGRSDWLPVAEHYGMPLYMSDCAAFLARLDVEEVDWVGTSMGGILGMLLAAQPNTPIRRLVLNDVGAFIPKAALERIGTYVGRAPDFAGPAEAEAYLRQTHAGFGALSDDDWRAMTGHSLRPAENGRLAFHCDPKIGDAFRQGLVGDVDLWPVWDAIRCPVLVLRGESSDLLTAGTVEAMKGRGPGCEAATIPGCGHAPGLMDEAQIRLVADWLG